MRPRGSFKAANIALLGAAARSGVLGFSIEKIEASVKMLTKEKYFKMNQKALRLGAETAENGGEEQ